MKHKKCTNPFIDPDTGFCTRCGKNHKIGSAPDRSKAHENKIKKYKAAMATKDTSTLEHYRKLNQICNNRIERDFAMKPVIYDFTGNKVWML